MFALPISPIGGRHVVVGAIELANLIEGRDRRQGETCAQIEAQIRGRDIGARLTVVRTVGEVPPTVEKVGHRRIGEAERIAAVAVIARVARSEEHTSELQSLMRISYAGFCLKKK